MGAQATHSLWQGPLLLGGGHSLPGGPSQVRNWELQRETQLGRCSGFPGQGGRAPHDLKTQEVTLTGPSGFLGAESTSW